MEYNFYITDWDSVSSQPQGLLYGNRYQLGNFDECMNAPWSKTNPELKTQYCLAEIVLERTDHVARQRSKGHVEPYQSALDFIQVGVFDESGVLHVCLVNAVS